MSTTAKLSAFVLSLAATFGLAVGVGTAVGPIEGTSTENPRVEPVEHSAVPDESAGATHPEEDR